MTQNDLVRKKATKIDVKALKSLVRVAVEYNLSGKKKKSVQTIQKIAKSLGVQIEDCYNKCMFNENITDYNQKQAGEYGKICKTVVREIMKGLPDYENKIWHGSPVG